MTKIGSLSFCQRHEYLEPDPHQNVMDPEHWCKSYSSLLTVGDGVKVGAAPAAGALQRRGQQVGHCLRSTRRHV
jgi:hypothetical protein